jgi:hypothetical protein
MNVGDAFYLPDFAGAHINFVLDVLSDGSVIICNFTDYNNHTDKTCVVEVGEHPNITKKSVVNFRKTDHCEAGARIEILVGLIAAYNKEPLDPLSAKLVARIRQGALDSPRTPDKIKNALQGKK